MAEDTIRDIGLDASGDWNVSAGDLQLVAGAEAIKQSVGIRLRFFRGEWFLDLDAGTPYYQSVLIKNPDPNVLRTVFRDQILGTLGIESVQSLVLSLAKTTRTLSINWRADSDVGLIESIEEL